MKCTYLGADNEKVVQSKTLFRNSNDYVIDFSLAKGILTMKELHQGESQQTTANITVSGENGKTILESSVTLPYQLTVPWVTSDVLVKTKNTKGTFSLDEVKEEQLGYQFYRRNDSVFLKVENPAGIPFWYTLRKKNKEIAKGYATQLDYSAKDNGREGYGMQLSYLFGKERRIEEILPVVQKNMSMDVSTPTLVYPGQKATVTISVTDKKGKPVENADITAYSFTSKFENYFMPYIAIKGIARYAKRFENKRYHPEENGIHNQKSLLSWERWNHSMSLDTMEYYQFLYPDIFYSYEELSDDGTTQIAPYVVIDGALQGVHLLWMDDRLLYAKQAQQLDRYLFRIPPGMHDLKFRTHDREISVKNVLIKERTKTILSFDAGIPYIRKNVYGDSISPFSLVSKSLKKKEQGILSKEEMDYLTTQLITVDNNFGKILLPGMNKYLELPAYINTGNTNYYLNFKPRTYYNNTLRATVNATLLAGPFPYRNMMNGLPDMATVYSDGKPLVNIQIEEGYNYTLLENFQKMKSWEHSPIVKQAQAFIPPTDFKTGLLTGEDINNYFNETLISDLISFSGRINSKKTNDNSKQNTCRMSLFLVSNQDGSQIKPALIWIVPQNKEEGTTDDCLYYGSTRQFRDLPEGTVNIHLVFGDTTSYTTSTTLYREGQNYLQLDSIGREEDKKIAEAAFNLFQQHTIKIFATNPYLDTQKNAVIDVVPSVIKTFDKNNLQKGIITGTVKNDLGEPLIGVSVVLRNKSKRVISGISTNINGHFELKGNSDGDKISIAYLGFTPIEVGYTEGYNYGIVLKEDAIILNEVVIIGHGSKSKTGSLNIPAREIAVGNSTEFQGIEDALQGRIAGLDATESIRIRGVSGIDELTSSPLIILNGLPYNGKWEDIDPSAIVSSYILKDQASTAVYGPRGANGVIIVQTQSLKSMETQRREDTEPGNSMRRNFHDDAFWQPSLKTNEKGEASFEVTYPDDITSWNAYFLAIGNRKQADKKEMTIQSFKALTARLSTPRFAIRGDSLNAVGKIANHLNDSIEVSETVSIEGINRKETIRMTTSHVEQIPVTVSGGDSITVAYSINRLNGYFDGEERSFPIFEPGMLQTHGEFKVINDTVPADFNVNPDLGTVTLHAEASSMDVFLKEIDKIDRYPYLCNEQMASKIKALLAKKKIATLLEKEFKDDNKIKDLISRLTNNSNSEGMWGWWNKTKTEFWISRQIIDAMLDAKKEGYKVNIDSEKICSIVEQQIKDGLAALSMIASLEAPFAKQELLDRLVLLKKLNAPVDYQSYYAQIGFHLKSNTVNEKVKEIFLLSMLGMNEKINLDTLIYYSHKTMLGSMYWGEVKEDKYSFAYLSPSVNNVENTLMAYTVLKNTGGHETELEKIRYYFFERRHNGSWQNTYETSRIIETIMPDMLNPNTNYSEVSMNMNDKKIFIFPFTEKMDTKQPIRIKKEGTLPLFVTVYQQEWNPNPQPESSKGLAVQTIFKENQDTVSNLKAGKTVNLEVVVTVEANADYVQIEVPIPAGCSYESKNQSFFGKEAHREYFKEKVSIFCNRLTKGEHRFTIELIPRFTGKYTLNPAKAELMYFLTFYGNEKVKSTEID